MSEIQFKQSSIPQGAHEMAKKILSYLNDGKKVLWLVCGGSNIPISAEILNILKTELDKKGWRHILKHLTVTLTDERYGSINHPDSNWRQLQEKGFDFEAVNAVPVLVGKSLDETTKLFGMHMRDAWNDNDVAIGQFGIGQDGHIAGVLPRSKAVKNVGTVFAYEASPFKRITITLATIEKLDFAYAFVYGESKREAMANLKLDLTFNDEPAQVLKKVKEAVIFSV